MTTDRPTTRPPRWAESLLRTTLPAKDRDSISGDLLEEYRESIVPSRGRGATRWYLRQVAGYVLRQAWVWGALIGAILVVRYLFDTLVPVQDYTVRSAEMTQAILVIAFAAAAQIAFRARSLAAGLVIATLAGALGGAISIAGAGVLLAIWHDPQTLREWQRSGGIDEAIIVVPLIMVGVGVVMGAAGAIAGRLVAAIYGASRLHTKGA